MPKTGKKFTVEEYYCRTCGTKIYPKIKNGRIQPLPRACPNRDCNSPYWNQEIQRPTVSKAKRK